MNRRASLDLVMVLCTLTYLTAAAADAAAPEGPFHYDALQHRCVDDAGAPGFNAGMRGPCGDYRSADLRGVLLKDVDLRGANLAGADLREARLFRVQLEGADLRGARLQGAHLMKADLSFARLENADLREAHLGNVVWTGARIAGADFRGARVPAALIGEAEDGSTWPRGRIVGAADVQVLEIPDDVDEILLAQGAR